MCDQCPSSPIESPSLARRHFLKLAGATAVGLLASAPLRAAGYPTPKPQNAISPDAALDRLIKGNNRYVKGTMRRHDFEAERPALALGQNPYAGILSCADSRIGPEYTFDTGRGDIFVCRIAGNFAETDSIASFEYGVAVLGLPLILVLGHSLCGAVSSTISAVKDGTEFPGHIPSLIRHLRPAVKAALPMPGDLLTNAIRENVILNVKTLRNSSPILSKAVEQGKLKIVGGVYELTTGRVDFIS